MASLVHRPHSYALRIEWTGNRGTGTSSYRDYGRDHTVAADGKPLLHGSSDPAFHGDRTSWNPEELLVAAVAQCHLLTYLHLAVKAGVTVVDYTDEATGTMTEDGKGGGQFTEITLHPRVTITDPSQSELAAKLHGDVGEYCFIARSVNFPIHHEPLITALVSPPTG